MSNEPDAAGGVAWSHETCDRVPVDGWSGGAHDMDDCHKEAVLVFVAPLDHVGGWRVDVDVESVGMCLSVDEQVFVPLEGMMNEEGGQSVTCSGEKEKRYQDRRK